MPLSAEFVKMCKEQILQDIKAELLKTATKIYEERFSSMRADLEALNDPQEPDIAESFVRDIPTVIQFERTMYRARRDALPSNPETQSSIDTDCIYGQNIRGESILVGDDPGIGENDRILLFSDPDLVEAAANCRRVNIDGTFKGGSQQKNYPFWMVM